MIKSQTELLRLYSWKRLWLQLNWILSLTLLTWVLAQMAPSGACFSSNAYLTLFKKIMDQPRIKSRINLGHLEIGWLVILHFSSSRTQNFGLLMLQHRDKHLHLGPRNIFQHEENLLVKKVAWGTYLEAKKGINESLEEERGDVYELCEDESFFTFAL